RDAAERQWFHNVDGRLTAGDGDACLRLQRRRDGREWRVIEAVGYWLNFQQYSRGVCGDGQLNGRGATGVGGVLRAQPGGAGEINVDRLRGVGGSGARDLEEAVLRMIVGAYFRRA